MVWIALLAEADVRGRICAGQQELLERIELFRTLCQEAQCYSHPRPFATDHSRFIYFRNPRAGPAYTAYDDTTFEVVLISGLPGAGKDTWIKQNRANWPVISLDMNRKELKVAPTEKRGAVVRVAKTRARELMRRRQSFVWNSTNVTRTLRRQLIDFFASYGDRIHIVYIDAPFEVLVRRNRYRQERVPEQVIHKLANMLEVPDKT